MAIVIIKPIIPKKNVIWFSAIDYPYDGSIINYNITSKKFNVFHLTEEAGIPISIIEDDLGKLWLNDHATSLFLNLILITAN